VIESMSSRLRLLYSQEFAGRNDIIGGGVVDEDAYVNSKPKVLWILREPYNMATYTNTAELLRQKVERFYQTGTTIQSSPVPWLGAKVMGVCTYVVQHGFRGYEQDYTNENAAAGARCLAVTNLKKTQGAQTANLSEIRGWANSEKVCWTRELEIIMPDIVLCGGTYGDVLDALRDQPRLEGEKLYTSDASHQPKNRDYSFALLPVGDRMILLLDWHHPDPRGKGPMRRQYQILENIAGALRAKGLFPYHQSICFPKKTSVPQSPTAFMVDLR
jgi:hypothetical protein